EVETIAKYYLREIQTIQKTGPFFLGGYSFGGIVALEMAQQLVHQKEKVGLLMLLDPPPFSKTYHLTFVDNPSVDGWIRRHTRALAPLKPKERIEYIIPRLRGTFNSKTAPIRRVFRRVICKVCVTLGYRIRLSMRSSYILNIYRQARAGYLPQPYSGRVILFKGKSRSYNARSDWDELLNGEIELHEVSDDHVKLREQSGVQTWAENFKLTLLKAQSGDSSLPNDHADS